MRRLRQMECTVCGVFHQLDPNKGFDSVLSKF